MANTVAGVISYPWQEAARSQGLDLTQMSSESIARHVLAAWNRVSLATRRNMTARGLVRVDDSINTPYRVRGDTAQLPRATMGNGGAFRPDLLNKANTDDGAARIAFKTTDEGASAVFVVIPETDAHRFARLYRVQIATKSARASVREINKLQFPLTDEVKTFIHQVIKYIFEAKARSKLGLDLRAVKSDILRAHVLATWPQIPANVRKAISLRPVIVTDDRESKYSGEHLHPGAWGSAGPSPDGFVIWLSPALVERDPTFSRCTFLHECAHLHLGHGGASYGDATPSAKARMETEADTLAAQWINAPPPALAPPVLIRGRFTAEGLAGYRF